MTFEWDPDKEAHNRRTHGISFHEAATVFSDPLALTFHDPDHSIAELRFITVGMSNASRVLIVAHADRGDNIRIINARKTTARERKQYEEEKGE
ncbi:MAG: BrnT family toxin [Candidatus Acidiferrales bacterium]